MKIKPGGLYTLKWDYPATGGAHFCLCDRTGLHKIVNGDILVCIGPHHDSTPEISDYLTQEGIKIFITDSWFEDNFIEIN